MARELHYIKITMYDKQLKGYIMNTLRLPIPKVKETKAFCDQGKAITKGTGEYWFKIIDNAINKIESKEWTLSEYTLVSFLKQLKESADYMQSTGQTVFYDIEEEFRKIFCCLDYSK